MKFLSNDIYFDMVGGDCEIINSYKTVIITKKFEHLSGGFRFEYNPQIYPNLMKFHGTFFYKR